MRTEEHNYHVNKVKYSFSYKYRLYLNIVLTIYVSIVTELNFWSQSNSKRLFAM